MLECNLYVLCCDGTGPTQRKRRRTSRLLRTIQVPSGGDRRYRTKALRENLVSGSGRISVFIWCDVEQYGNQQSSTICAPRCGGAYHSSHAARKVKTPELLESAASVPPPATPSTQYSYLFKRDADQHRLPLRRRHPADPFRSRPGRSAARPAGNALWRQFVGWHHSIYPEQAGSRNVQRVRRKRSLGHGAWRHKLRDVGIGEYTGHQRCFRYPAGWPLWFRQRLDR